MVRLINRSRMFDQNTKKKESKTTKFGEVV